MDPVLIWIVSLILGCLIGSAKGRVVSGFVWSLLLGPLGVLIVLCLPNLKKEEENAKARALAQEQVRLQEAQLRQLQELGQRPIRGPESSHLYHVGRNGQA